MLNNILWLPKHLFMAHFRLFVNLAHPRCAQAEIDRKIEAMRRRLFGDD
jgi:hypothetical protein